jgi:hypothetical protein
VMVSDHDVTGLEVGRGATGVRVSGRVVSPDSSPGTFASLPIIISGTFTATATATAGGGPGVITTSGSTTSTSFQARPDSTGAFEFLRVPPGSYVIRVPVPGLNQSVSLVVGDKRLQTEGRFRFKEKFRAESCSKMDALGHRQPAP